MPSDGIVGPRQVIGVEIIAGREWEDVVSSGGVKRGKAGACYLKSEIGESAALCDETNPA